MRPRGSVPMSGYRAHLLAARAADPPAPGSFPNLIARLGAGDPAVRDQATRQLVAAGHKALDPLTAGLRAGTAPHQASFEVIVQLGLAADAETSRLARTRLDELARSPDT